VLPPGEDRQEEEQCRSSAAGDDEERGWNLSEWDHESCTGLESDLSEDTSPWASPLGLRAGDRYPSGVRSAMAFLDTKQDRAAFLIFVLGLGLVWALWPFSTGLIGAPVLYIVFAPVHRWLAGQMHPRLAAALVVLMGIIVVLGPGAGFVGVIAGEAQDMASGVIRSPLLARLRELRIGPYDVGAQIESVGSRLVAWIGSSALGLIGTATRLGIQLTIAFFGLYYLLLAPETAWKGVRPFIPFSGRNAERLRDRFRDVTISTLIGTGMTAAMQGLLVGLAFWVTGIPNALFWGVVTVILAILPVVGSGLVWAPAVLALAIEGHYGMAIGLALWGVLVVGNVDNIIRPAVFRRWAQIHPFITIIGAFAGINYFGLLGLIIGPLAISYFFELIRMYREEYLQDEDAAQEIPIQHGVKERTERTDRTERKKAEG
jgi:predicted PurR-regulated permease PerM